jgi:hypothetical protein
LSSGLAARSRRRSSSILIAEMYSTSFLINYLTSDSACLLPTARSGTLYKHRRKVARAFSNFAAEAIVLPRAN